MKTLRRAAPREVDVAVVGGGVVGLTLASLLSRAPLRVAVVETRPSAPWAAGDEYELRTFALTRASAAVLESAGAWGRVERERHGCFRRMEVWDERSSGRIEFDAVVLAEPTLGYIVEQGLLCEALEQQLRERANVTWYRPAALSSWSAVDDRLTVTLKEGRRFGTRVLIGADGADSRVRTLAGIGYQRHDYEQEALVCNVRTELPHADTARQRFLASGPLAFLPLDEPRTCSIVWSTTPQEARRLCAVDPAAFAEELAQAFEHVLGKITEVGRRVAFRLTRGRAEHYLGSRIALVGDAAHTIHPLAGQGLNLGLLDAAALAEIITEAAERSADIGSPRTLRRYERWRKGENMLMQSMMDGFKFLFGSRQPMLCWMRGTGLTFTDRCQPLKEFIMRRAMGLEGDLPAAARGEVPLHAGNTIETASKRMP